MEILQQIRAQENRNAIEELKLKSRQLITENEGVKSYQFQQQVARKKQQLFKGLLPEKYKSSNDFKLMSHLLVISVLFVWKNMKSVET